MKAGVPLPEKEARISTSFIRYKSMYVTSIKLQ
jgi:hypothetical protein